MSQDDDRKMFMESAFAGMTTGAMIEAFNEMAKELRRYAGGDFDKCLNALEAKAVRSIENAAIDGIAENDQLMLVEKTREVIMAVFGGARFG
jgi:hypothetical protein